MIFVYSHIPWRSVLLNLSVPWVEIRIIASHFSSLLTKFKCIIIAWYTFPLLWKWAGITLLNWAVLIKDEPWSCSSSISCMMLSEIYLIDCVDTILFVTSWPLYCFLFQNEWQANIKHCPTSGTSPISAVHSGCCRLSTFWAKLNATDFCLFFSGPVAPSSKILASFYCMDSPVFQQWNITLLHNLIYI